MAKAADWKINDWVVFDLKVGQVTEVREYGHEFSDGFFKTSGRLADRFRPLTLPNKRVVETFDIIYDRLREIDGNSGFNYPDIHSYFCALALEAIDNPDAKKPYDQAEKFVRDARDYKKIIQGVELFRSQRKVQA